MTMKQTIINKLMDRGIEIARQCPETCRDFRIMTSSMRKATLILRWTAIDLSDEDKPVQCFRYECFNVDGSPQNCSVHYASVTGANAFFASLVTHYQQDCCGDHACASATSQSIINRNE